VHVVCAHTIYYKKISDKKVFIILYCIININQVLSGEIIMRIIRIAGKKVRVKFVVNRKTGEVQMIPQEGYNEAHEGIANLLPTTNGSITPNDPDAFPKRSTAIPEEGDLQRDVMTL